MASEHSAVGTLRIADQDGPSRMVISTPRRASVRATRQSAPAAETGAPAAADVTDRWVARVVLAMCALLVVLSLGRALLGLTVFAGTDVLYEVPPWSAQAAPGFAPQNPYVGDPTDGIYPQAAEFAARLHGGDVASWSSLSPGGSELGTTAGSRLLSPLSLPYLLLPGSLAPGFVKLLELVVAIGATFLFARRIGLGRAAGLLGGLAFATSGFLVAWTSWPQAAVASLVPALFWALERLLQSRAGRDVGVVALVVAALLLSGFPSVVVYALYAALPYVLVRLVVLEQRSMRRVVGGGALVAAGIGGGILVAAGPLLALVHQLGDVQLGSRLQGPDNFLPVTSLVTLLVPDGLGTTAPDVGWLGPRNPIESFSYAGVAVVLLACVGLLLGRRSGAVRGVRAFFAVALVVWGVAVYGGGPVLAVLQELPSMAFNPIGRARSVLGFFMAVLAAVGFDVLVRSAPGRGFARRPLTPDETAGRARMVRFVTGAGLALAIVALLVHGHAYATEEGFVDTYEGRLVVAGGLAALASAAVLLALRGHGRWRQTGLAVVPVLVLAQALSVALPWWPEVPRTQYYPDTATHRFLAAELGHDRFLATDDAMLPGSNLHYGLRSLDGHAFMRTEFADLLRAVDPDGFVVPTLFHPGSAAAFSSAALLDRLGVRYVVAPPASDVAGQRHFLGAGGDEMRWEPGTTLRVDVAADSLRGAGVVLAQPVADLAVPSFIEARLLDPSGVVVATGSRTVEAGTSDEVVIALAADDVAAAPAVVELTLRSATPLVLAADGSVPQLVEVRPSDDGLRLVRAGETTIYERLTGLPRIRWAGSSIVEPDGAAVIDMLRSGRAPDVVLAEAGPSADGSSASVQVLEDSGDTIRARVVADGPGYLVVADALAGTFSAAVGDGAAPLRVTDHGYVAVAVPAGEHVVTLTYDPPLHRLGWTASSLALLAALGLVLVPARWGRRRQSR